jgi:glutathione S-transferase
MSSATSSVNLSPVTVGYWSIRGLGAPLRMMAMYAGCPLNAVNYDCRIKEGGGYDGSDWFNDKPELKAKNPFINLPYIQDGDVLVTQTNACLSYMGRKLGLWGNNPTEETECEQLLCEV